MIVGVIKTNAQKSLRFTFVNLNLNREDYVKSYIYILYPSSEIFNSTLKFSKVFLQVYFKLQKRKNKKKKKRKSSRNEEGFRERIGGAAIDRLGFQRQLTEATRGRS